MSASHERDPIQGEIVHEYDGILEADNHLPTWWLITFFGAIAFGILYWMAYEAWHFADHPRQIYAAEMARRAAEGGEVSEELLAMLADQPDTVSAGQATFATNCAACHGASGEGNIGPNLTDGYWLHGGGPTDIHHTVAEGVTTAGMPAWGPVLGPTGVQQVVAYLLTIRDTNVEGRDPQGELWTPGASSPTEGGSAPEAEATEGDAPSEAEPEATGEGGDTPTEGTPEGDAEEGAGAPEGSEAEAIDPEAGAIAGG